MYSYFKKLYMQVHVLLASDAKFLFLVLYITWSRNAPIQLFSDSDTNVCTFSIYQCLIPTVTANVP